MFDTDPIAADLKTRWMEHMEGVAGWRRGMVIGGGLISAMIALAWGLSCAGWTFWMSESWTGANRVGFILWSGCLEVDSPAMVIIQDGFKEARRGGVEFSGGWEAQWFYTAGTLATGEQVYRIPLWPLFLLSASLTVFIGTFSARSGPAPRERGTGRKRAFDILAFTSSTARETRILHR